MYKKRIAIDEDNAVRQKAIIYRNRLEGQVDNLSTQIANQKQVVQNIKDEQVKEECTTCGQDWMKNRF